LIYLSYPISWHFELFIYLQKYEIMFILCPIFKFLLLLDLPFLSYKLTFWDVYCLIEFYFCALSLEFFCIWCKRLTMVGFNCYRFNLSWQVFLMLLLGLGNFHYYILSSAFLLVPFIWRVNHKINGKYGGTSKGMAICWNLDITPTAFVMTVSFSHPLNSKLLSISALLQGRCWPTCSNREAKNQRHNRTSENEELLAGKPYLLQDACTSNLHLCFIIMMTSFSFL